jgi:O-succinylbenzoic acid--CoA ligase
MATREAIGPGETELVAAIAAGEELARAAVAAWDAGEALLPLRPDAPGPELRGLLERMRPTVLVDAEGRRRLAGGAPVPAGTAAVVVTSGTTGAPKGVELTRAGMEVMARGYSAGVGAHAGSCWLACLPLQHVASLAALARAHVTGVRWVAHERFDADRVARAPRDEGATIVSLVPTALARLLDAGADLDAYECVIVGGAPFPPALRARAEGAGVRVVDAYGMTETWGGWALDGRPIDGAVYRLAPDGEVLVRGDVVMRGYRFDPVGTAAVLDRDGWLRTGDVGVVEDGRLRVVDRKKDVVVTGGVNVSPTEVEGVLARHPAVADVCVVGLPDDEWGERVVAFVVPAAGHAAPGLEDLREFARRELSAAKLPREVHRVGEIPRSGSGKPLRRLLRG